MFNLSFVFVSLISMLNNIFSSFANTISDKILYTLLTLILLFLGHFGKYKKIKKAFLAVVLAFILTSVFKYYFHIPRPCINDFDIISKNCPSSYGFPSGHASVAFALAVSFIKTPVFILYVIYSLLVAYSRVYLNVHTFYQVAASLSIAGFSFYAIDTVLRGNTDSRIKTPARFEDYRQYVHVIASIIFVILYLIFGKFILVYALFGALVFGGLIINAKILFGRLPVISTIEEFLERPGVRIPAFGVFLYSLGVLFLLSSPLPQNFVISGILILGFGDAASTLVGRKYGQYKIFYGKSLEGFLAFFLASFFVSFPFLGLFSFLVSLLAAFVELFSWRIDDNITVPLFLSCFFYLFV